MDERVATLSLEIRNGSNPTETVPISPRQPIGIGRHASNEVCIDDASVAPMHCRVAWNGTQLEVAAASRDGVDLNGTFVRHSTLKAGDVLRIGPADLIVRSSASATKSPHGPQPREDQSAAALPVILDPKDVEESGDILLRDDDDVALRSDDGVAAQQGWDRRVFRPNPSSGMADQLRRGEASQGAGTSPAVQEKIVDTVGTLLDAEDENIPEGVLPGIKKRPLSARLTESLGPRRVRPGEQEALRSPLILAMLGGALALALAAAAIYFVIGRETVQQQYNAAAAEYEAKHFGQAADMFQKFITQHNGHKLTADAQYQMWNARILKEIGGGSPAWKRGLEAIEQSVEANRDRKDFREHNVDLANFLTQIALGASASAQSSSDRSLLEISSSAEAMLPRYFPEGTVPAELTTRLRASYTSAQDAIIKHETVAAGLSEIEKENKARHPMPALAARRALLARYPEMAADSRLVTLLKRTLDIEKGLVVREEPNKPAIQHPRDASLPALTLTPHTRSRTEEPAGTRPVFVLAKDCCFAVDHVTGEPIWRHGIGLDTPFFPVKVETSVPGLLFFNSNRLSLMLIDRKTGEPIWEQALDEAVSGPPLIDQGQIYIATVGQHLYKIELESGRIITRLTFSQKILSPPALTRNKERLIVAGDASLIYTLTASPLECLRVNDLGHPAGSLVNGVTAVGGLALLTEPGRTSGTRLHVFDAQNDETWLKLVDTQTVEGQVRDTPVIYGKMLFIASVPARISAFVVSDTPGQESLAPATSLAIPNQQDSLIFLTPGPDGQLWMAGSSVRQLQLKLNSQTFSLAPAEVAIGISSQPLQVVGQYLYAARRLPFASSVFFSEIERERMTGQWRTVFGASIIGAAVFPGGEIVTVGEAGDVFSVALAELGSAGFKSSASATVEPDPSTQVPLRATRLHDGKIAVDSAGPKPMLWFIGPGGQSAGSFALEKPLEAPPVTLAAGLVLPLPGRLRLVSPSSGQRVAEEQPAPLEKGKTARWKSVERISDTELVALDSANRLSRFQYRTDPERNLAETVTKELEKPSDTGVVVLASRVAYADTAGVLHFLDAATLEPIATHKLSAPAVGRLLTAGSLLLVETNDHQLAAFDASGPTKSLFTTSLGQTGPCGPPALIGDHLVVANRDGTVMNIDPASGTLVARVAIGHPLAGGVLSVERHPVVFTVDGSLCRVDLVLESPKKGP
ncbi:MAG TPA: PQQ-binding-like beta-propeller repeat protein [Planctomycetaceae bacterium]|nr:PQQ-binding-like beta-propeller repeat protein [Planctomycetaceae bacterium]